MANSLNSRNLKVRKMKPLKSDGTRTKSAKRRSQNLRQARGVVNMNLDGCKF